MVNANRTKAEAEHAVIARYRLAEEGFGGHSQRAAIRQAQELLISLIDRAGVGEFDGNEFGNGAVALYAYGPDADALYGVMAPVLRDLAFRPAHVVLRYGSAADTSVSERRIDL